LKNFLLGAGLIFSLEMRQRLRGVAWYVLLGVFFLILAIVTIVTIVVAFGFGAASQSNAAQTREQIGSPVYSLIIYFVLLLGTLVAPAMSGNAINGDRDAGTLATTQVTLVTTGQIVFGKFLAAWVTALGFLLVSSPFLILAAIVGNLNVATVLVSILVLALELGVVAAIGVGLSGLITRPLFSVVVTYLAVAALSLGTLIVFALGGLAVQTHTVHYYYDNVTRSTQKCTGLTRYSETDPRFDLVWGALVANPYVLLGDAVPSTYVNGSPADLFGDIKVAERQVQIPPHSDTPATACKEALATNSDDVGINGQTSEQIVNSTTPGWAVGLGIQVVLAGFAMWGAWMKTRTPARGLSAGSRIA
jgi:ABC-2 type transport system permease protein